ncbi:MAG: hypothetical protein KA165_17940 [Saprospiraceae bacterium]|nr:hypothetical protein [Saprospiraceae bacterium]
MKLPVLLVLCLLLSATLSAQNDKNMPRGCDSTFVRGDTVVCVKHYGKKATMLKYYKDGNLLFSKNFRKLKNGEVNIITYRKGLFSKKEGEAVLLYASGRLKARTWLTSGKMDGPNLSYYENGARQCVCRYKKGKRDGEQFTFYPNGQLQWNAVYEEGRLKTVKGYFFDSGEPAEVGTFQDGNGDLFIYDAAGQKAGVETYKNGKVKKIKKIKT